MRYIRYAAFGAALMSVAGCATFFQPTYKLAVYEKATGTVNSLAKIEATFKASGEEYVPYAKLEPLFIESIASAKEANVEARARAESLPDNRPAKIPAAEIVVMSERCLTSISLFQAAYKQSGDGSNPATRYAEPAGDIATVMITCRKVKTSETLFKE